MRQESQRDDVISKVFQIDGPESDVEHQVGMQGNEMR